MITFDQARDQFGAADLPHAAKAARVLSEDTPRVATQILHATLFLTILCSSLVFVEPAPYEFAICLLGFACLLARISLNRFLLPLFLLLLTWNIGGIIGFFRVASEDMTGRFTIISVFMAVSAVIFACLFSNDTERRLTITRNAYILSALFAAVAGIAGYFNLFHGAQDLFAPSGRATGTFKDPNVYGPFLILPILLLLQTLLTRGLRPLLLAALCVLLLGFFLSFSRGAWMHFVLSAGVMLVLMFVTASDVRMQMRLIVLTAIGIAFLAAAFAAALSFDTIAVMFAERARVVQDYDVGSGGRFALQMLAFDSVMRFPWGMGPFEFGRVHGLQQHNVYLQAFLVYGWLGGISYLALLVLTLWIGLRNALRRAPWQPFAIAALATFVGEVGEGVIIDSDHWRHFFLLLGLIWGLAAASHRFQKPSYPS